MKVSKASVDYSLGHPRGDRCGVCKHFQKPNKCEIVAGLVKSNMWCKRFKRIRVTTMTEK